MLTNWKTLQNGSDIRGVALPLNPNETVNFDESVSFVLGISFGKWLSESQNIPTQKLCIGVGKDSRLSGDKLKDAFKQGLSTIGAKVLDFGLATTPAMFMSTQFEGSNCDGAVMITASHLPPNRNGMKFFTKKSGLGKEDISALLKLAESNRIKPKYISIEKNISDIITPYSKFIIQYIRKHTGEELPLRGLKIIVDAGNGAGGFFAAKILSPLGADTTGSQFLEPDGNFPNHTPNPEDKQAMKSIQEAVVNSKADLGIIFDTDVDRSAIVDNTGRPINRNALIALLSSIVLEEHPGSTIVTDSVTSDGLTDFITKLGGVHHRYKRGYKNVINESIRLNKEGEESWLAIETSGHGAMKENYNLDDGAYMVAKALIKMSKLNNTGKKLTELIADLEEAIEASEFRIDIDTANFQEYGQKIIDELKIYVSETPSWQPEKINHEGLRVSCKLPNGKGWFLLRLSLHDPVLPLNIESNEAGGIEQIAGVLRPFFKKFELLKNISLT